MLDRKIYFENRIINFNGKFNNELDIVNITDEIYQIYSNI